MVAVIQKLQSLIWSLNQLCIVSIFIDLALVYAISWLWKILLMFKSAGRLVGVGEASFVSLGAPFILDVAPPSQVKCYYKNC